MTFRSISHDKCRLHDLQVQSSDPMQLQSRCQTRPGLRPPPDFGAAWRSAAGRRSPQNLQQKPGSLHRLRCSFFAPSRLRADHDCADRLAPHLAAALPHRAAAPASARTGLSAAAKRAQARRSPASLPRTLPPPSPCPCRAGRTALPNSGYGLIGVYVRHGQLLVAHLRVELEGLGQGVAADLAREPDQLAGAAGVGGE